LHAIGPDGKDVLIMEFAYSRKKGS
jgi:hypothetical protein